jgi:hypothetical protein
MLRIYIIGISILIIAIIANGIVIKLGIKSWYDLIELLQAQGSSAFEKLSVLDYIWLFIAYPLILGFGYWIGDKIYQAFSLM